MNLLFSINQKFIPLWQQCMATILRHGGADRYDIYVLHSDLTGADAMQMRQILRPADRLYIRCSATPSEKLSLDWVRRNTVVIHYLGKPKPWQKSYIGPLGVFYQEELALTGAEQNGEEA